MKHAFGGSEPFALGVEEELLLVAGEDGRPAEDGAEVLEQLSGDLHGELTSELHACEVEAVSPVVRTAGEGAAALARLRAAVIATGAAPRALGLSHDAQ